MNFLVAVCASLCCILMTVFADLTVYVPKHKDCLLTKDPGDCWFYETRYAYDMLKGKCVKFDYSGCGGNKNRFKTRSKCIEKCIDGYGSGSSESSESSSSSSTSDDSSWSWIWDW